jgi:hypothetical protein
MFKESNRQKDSKGDYVPVERGRRRERLVPKWQTMSLLDLGAADSLLSGEWDDLTDAADAAGGVGMKTGAGGHPQPYDAHGRYTGPTGGVYDRATGEIRTFGGEDDGGEVLGGEGMELPAQLRPDTMTAQDAAPAVYTPDADGEPLATTMEDANDAGNALDVIPASSQDGGGWDNESRRLEEKQFTPERLVQNARADIGSDTWAPTYENGVIKNHCNEYVASKLRESGAHVPNIGGVSGTFGEEASDKVNEMSGGKWGGNIPSAQDWHDGVPGFERVRTEEGESPLPGDVASNGRHVGIVSGTGNTVSVTTRDPDAPDYGRVVETRWGFRLGNSEEMTFWRYVGRGQTAGSLR